jgi:hypothetical protein
VAVPRDIANIYVCYDLEATRIKEGTNNLVGLQLEVAFEFIGRVASIHRAARREILGNSEGVRA